MTIDPTRSGNPTSIKLSHCIISDIWKSARTNFGAKACGLLKIQCPIWNSKRKRKGHIQKKTSCTVTPTIAAIVLQRKRKDPPIAKSVLTPNVGMNPKKNPIDKPPAIAWGRSRCVMNFIQSSWRWLRKCWNMERNEQKIIAAKERKERKKMFYNFFRWISLISHHAARKPSDR